MWLERHYRERGSDMKIREDGKYELADGRVLTQEEVIRLHKAALTPPEATQPRRRRGQQLELKEGQSSGPVTLHD